MKTKIIRVFLALILSTSITACSSNKSNSTQTKMGSTSRNNKIATTSSTPSTNTVSSTNDSSTPSPATSDSKNNNASAKASYDNNNNNNNTAETPLKAYKAVLQNKSEFYNTNAKKTVTLSNFLANNGYVECVFKAPHFAVLDMDGDKVPEVVIELAIGNNYGEFYEVLHYTDGKVYGYLFPIRCLTGIKTDGTFGYSSGARDNGFGKLSFQGSTCITDSIGYKKSEGSTQQYELYFIDNKQVTPDKYNSFQKEQEDKKETTWYVFCQNSIDEKFPVNP